MSTFSSTAAAVVSLSTDLLARVLASRLSSCIKVQPAADVAAFLEDAAYFADVGDQAVQLFVHVHFLGQHDQLLLQAIRVRELDHVLDAGAQAFALGFLDAGDGGFDDIDLGADAIQPVDDQLAQLLAFPACVDQGVRASSSRDWDSFCSSSTSSLRVLSTPGWRRISMGLT